MITTYQQFSLKNSQDLTWQTMLSQGKSFGYQPLEENHVQIPENKSPCFR